MIYILEQVKSNSNVQLQHRVAALSFVILWLECFPLILFRPEAEFRVNPERFISPLPAEVTL